MKRMILLSIAFAMVLGGGVALADGLGKRGAKTKITMNNVGAHSILSTNIDHYSKPGAKKATFVVDIVDDNFEQVDSVAISYSCSMPNDGFSNGSQDNDDQNVSGKKKAKVSVDLPEGNLGCTVGGRLFHLPDFRQDDRTTVIKKMKQTITSK